MNTFIRHIFRKEFVYLGIITIALIGAAFYICSITSRSVTRYDNDVLNAYYSPLESEFVSEARALLNDRGFRNSGVSLTHTTDEELMRCYTLSVHHKRFNDITEEQKEEVIEQLMALGFSDDRCTIVISLI